MSSTEIKTMLEKLGALEVKDLFTQDDNKTSSCSACGGSHDLEEDCPIDEWDNSPNDSEGEPMIDEPDPNYRAGGLNKPGQKESPAVNGGGNPMTVRQETKEDIESRIKAELTALYKL